MLSGMNVLVVEDDPTIAMDISDLIERAEGSVVGPVGSLREARQVVKGEQVIDAAVLDVNLADGNVTPVLEALRGVFGGREFEAEEDGQDDRGQEQGRAVVGEDRGDGGAVRQGRRAHQHSKPWAR